MEYVIYTSKPLKLNWAAKGTERILQNVWNLMNTFHYEVAFHRTMGINPKLLDKPCNIAASEYISNIFTLIPKFEPRATVKEVNFTGMDTEGNMQFKVVINI